MDNILIYREGTNFASYLLCPITSYCKLAGCFTSCVALFYGVLCSNVFKEDLVRVKPDTCKHEYFVAIFFAAVISRIGLGLIGPVSG